MKTLRKILTTGIFVGVSLFNPLYSQTTKRVYYKDGKDVPGYKSGQTIKVTHYKNKTTNSEAFEYEIYRQPKQSEKNIKFNSTNKKTTHYNAYQPKTNYSSTNKNNFDLENAVGTGAAIVGSYLLIKGIVSLFKENKTKHNNYQNEYQEIEPKKEIPKDVKNYNEDWFSEKPKDKGKFWGDEDEENYSGGLWNEKQENEKKSNNYFWKEINNEISNFKNDLFEATSDGKKVYIKYAESFANKGLEKIANKAVPGGNMIYEIVRDGPNSFWLKKVKDSERISGKFETKEEKTSGGIVMIIDDLTGNYRKKVYDIAESSLKFWKDVENEKIKEKYGENSPEYLNYKLFGATKAIEY